MTTSMTMQENSAFYIGKVFHKRYFPKVNQFTLPLYMAAIDLTEIPVLEEKYWWFSTRKFSPLQLKRQDYFSKLSVDQAEVVDSLLLDEELLPVNEVLRSKVLAISKALDADVSEVSKIVMLAQLRSFGVYFSPVNFYFLYDESSHAKFMLAEVSNTPWNQTHCYLIVMDERKATEKNFHVSPFMNLDMEYHWNVSEPENKVLIDIENWREERLFKAAFSAHRFPMDQVFWKVMLRWPVVGVSIVRGIYWQALKLFLKGVGFVPYQHGRK